MAKKKPPFIQINIDDPIFRAQLSVFTGDIDKIKEHLLNNDFEDYGEVYDAKYVPSNGHRAIILRKVDIGSLCHEIVHYCFEVLHTRGIPIEYANDEVFAYYYEMTLSNILKQIKLKL